MVKSPPAVPQRDRVAARPASRGDVITHKYSVLADILGRRPRTTVPPVVPALGDVLVRRPEYGPLEYADVIGRYDEEARIAHVRLRL